MDITYFVKTFEDAVMLANLDVKKIFNPEFDTVDEIAYKKLKVIARVLNGDWSKDWSNPSEYMYFPYFKFNIETNSFSYFYYFWNSYSYVGFGWGFKTPELAKYCAEQFIDLWNDYLKYNTQNFDNARK